MSNPNKIQEAIVYIKESISNIDKRLEKDNPFTKVHAFFLLLFTGVIALSSIISLFSKIGTYQMFSKNDKVYVINTKTGDVAECVDQGYGLQESYCNKRDFIVNNLKGKM